MVDVHRPTSTPHTPPKPTAPPTAHPAQGSVNPKDTPTEHVITHAPPLPVEQPTMASSQKPAMESADAEQEAGKSAMEMWKKRQQAEEDAGKAAVKRFAAARAPTLPRLEEHEME